MEILKHLNKYFLLFPLIHMITYIKIRYEKNPTLVFNIRVYRSGLHPNLSMDKSCNQSILGPSPPLCIVVCPIKWIHSYTIFKASNTAGDPLPFLEFKPFSPHQITVHGYRSLPDMFMSLIPSLSVQNISTNSQIMLFPLFFFKHFCSIIM